MENIIVYGVGINALKFIYQYGLIQIEYFIEGKKNIGTFCGKNVIRLNEALERRKNEKIIVASSENVYWEIKKELEELGMVEFQDFIYWECYQKKIAIIYGNCHTEPVKQALKQQKVFSDMYGFYPIEPIQELYKKGETILSYKALKCCDLFIHQAIRKNNGYGDSYASENAINILNKRCKIISIPNLHRMRSLYPQWYDSEAIIRGNINMFPFRDKYIDELYRNGKTADDIVSSIMNPDFLDSFMIEDMWSRFMDKVIMREKEWDIKVSRFIEDNYRNKKLFYDQNHPTNVIFVHVVEKILEILGFCATYEGFADLPSLDSFEIPVYASVKSVLRLQWDQEFYREKSRRSLLNRKMDLTEYVRQYISWNLLWEKEGIGG